jgi:integrase
MGVKLRQKALKGLHKGVSLYLDITIKGSKRSYEFLDLHIYKSDKPDIKAQKLEIGQKAAAKRLLEISNDEHGFSSASKKNANFIAYYEIVMNRRNGNTKEAWQSAFNQLKLYAGSSIPFKKVNKKWIEEFKDHLLSSVSSSSANTYFAKVKKALSEAVKDEIIQMNPALLVDPISVPEREINYLEVADIKKIMKTTFFNKDLKDAFLFCCFTGLRLSDVRKLKWSVIEEIKQDGINSFVIRFNQTKTRNNNFVYLSETAMSILGERGNDDDLVFNISDHSVSINRTLRLLLKKAKVNKPITFHGSRHTNATLLLSSGTDIYTVSKMLGHRDLRSTMRYTKVVDPLKKKAADSLPNLKYKK